MHYLIKKTGFSKNFNYLLTNVINQGLCLGCGTCVIDCPSGLKMSLNNNGEYLPEIDEKLCVNCGRCFEVCPGNFIPLAQTNVANIYKPQGVSDLIGCFNESYVAHSIKKKLRESATSGGIVTSILEFLLDQHLINGAIVAKIDENTWNTQTQIATTLEEIYSSKQSKYIIVPTNAILKKLKNLNGKFALVGLPCQIHGLLNYSKKNPLLKDKIFVTIGLFCGSNLKTCSLDFLLKKLRIKNHNSIIELKYRGGDYPGGFFIRLRNNKVIFIKRYYFNLLTHLFSLPRCLLCPDLTNELADVSVGDVTFGDKKTPFGVIISRSAIGYEIINLAKSSGFLHLRYLNPEKIIHSNLALLLNKKKGSAIRMAIRQRKGLKNPVYLKTEKTLPLSSEQIIYEKIQSMLRGKVFTIILKNLPLTLSLLFIRLIALFTRYASIFVYSGH